MDLICKTCGRPIRELTIDEAKECPHCSDAISFIVAHPQMVEQVKNQPKKKIAS